MAPALALRALLLSAALLCSGVAAPAPRAPPLGLSAARRALAHPAAQQQQRPPRLRTHPGASPEQLATCVQHWFETDLDHFSWVRRRAQAAPPCHAAASSLT